MSVNDVHTSPFDDVRSRGVSGRKGFTLLEVLVAMSVLVVLVLILTQMFHQSTMAWDAGMRTVDVNMETRVVLNAITLELSQAVGDEVLPLDMHTGSQIYFYTLKTSSVSNRAVERIVYQWNGQELLRTVETFQPQQNYYPNPTTKEAVQCGFLTNCITLQFKTPGDLNYTTNLPPWIDVRLVTRRLSTATVVAVLSSGPDRVANTQDDISSARER